MLAQERLIVPMSMTPINSEYASKPHPEQRFLVVGMQRSGTTLVHQLIAGHPDVFTHSREASTRLFTDFGAHYFNTDAGLFPTDHGPLNPVDADALLRMYFDVAVSHGGQPPEGAVRGLKIAIGYAKAAERFVEIVRHHFTDLFIVLVKRTDPVAACASFAFASKTGRFQVFQGDDEPFQRLKISREYLLRYIWNWSKINSSLDRLKELPNFLPISYEDDVLTQKLLSGTEVFEFLKVPQKQVNWISLKKSLASPKDTIQNFDEVAEVADKALAGILQGESYEEIFYKYGPSPPVVLYDMAKHAIRHPGAIRLKSFWAPMHWSIGRL